MCDKGLNQKLVLCQTPWGPTEYPSIALGILTSICKQNAVEVSCLYPNLDLAAEIGLALEKKLAKERRCYGISEHLFAANLFGSDLIASDSFIESWVNTYGGAPLDKPEPLKRLRDEIIPGFIDVTLHRILKLEPTVVGFSAPFNQIMSSLLLASRIKAVRPDVKIILGGASFIREMGLAYHRAMPDIIDHIFLGEAEEPFREFLRRIKKGETTKGIKGTTYQEGNEIIATAVEPLANLDDSPIPNYASFFEEAQRVREATGKIFNAESILFETSRGCWWGYKSHCLFCGIPSDFIKFRTKSVDHVISELISLSSDYKAVKFRTTDWILRRQGLEEFLLQIIKLDLDFEFFFEIRPDMDKSLLMKVKQAGIAHLQPGIESFSTPLLKHLRKHNSAIRHVEFLRWCREIGLNALYNILVRFPNDKTEWYLDMVKLISRLFYLQPPYQNAVNVEMHRYSALFEERESLGVSKCTVRSDYQSNFPKGMIDLDTISYAYQFEADTMADLDTYKGIICETIQKWIDAHKTSSPPKYEYSIGPTFLRIDDTRQGEGRILHFAELHKDVILLCDQIMLRERLMKDLLKKYSEKITIENINQAVNELIDADVLMAEGNLLLTLPIGKKPRSTEDLRKYVLEKSVSEKLIFEIHP